MSTLFEKVQFGRQQLFKERAQLTEAAVQGLVLTSLAKIRLLSTFSTFFAHISTTCRAKSLLKMVKVPNVPNIRIFQRELVKIRIYCKFSKTLRMCRAQFRQNLSNFYEFQFGRHEFLKERPQLNKIITFSSGISQAENFLKRAFEK